MLAAIAVAVAALFAFGVLPPGGDDDAVVAAPSGTTSGPSAAPTADDTASVTPPVSATIPSPSITPSSSAPPTTVPVTTAPEVPPPPPLIQVGGVGVLDPGTLSWEFRDVTQDLQQVSVYAITTEPGWAAVIEVGLLDPSWGAFPEDSLDAAVDRVADVARADFGEPLSFSWQELSRETVTFDADGLVSGRASRGYSYTGVRATFRATYEVQDIAATNDLVTITVVSPSSTGDNDVAIITSVPNTNPDLIPQAEQVASSLRVIEGWQGRQPGY